MIKKFSYSAKAFYFRFLIPSPIHNTVTGGEVYHGNLNIDDMTRWAIANLNYGELDGQQILEKSTYEVMWKPNKKYLQKLEKSASVGLWESIKITKWFITQAAIRDSIALLC